MNLRQRIPLIIIAIAGLAFLAGGLFFLAVAYKFYESGENEPLIITAFIGTVLAAIGLATLMNLPRIRDAIRSQARAKETYPDQQWMWREEWVAREIRSSGKSDLVGFWAFSLFWNGLVTILFIVMWDQIIGMPLGMEVLAILLFPAVGIILLIWAIRKTLHWAKFGNSLFRISSAPIPLGGTLSGSLVVPPPMGEASAVVVTLNGTRVTRSGKHNTTTILFQRETRIDRSSFSHTHDGIMIPVELPLPHEGDESDISGGYQTIHWTVTARADIPGVDFSASFEIPVYGRLEEASATPLSQRPAQSSTEYKVTIASTPSGATEIRFPPMRNPTASLGLLLFILFWSFFFVLMVNSDAPLFFQILWGAVDLAMIAGLLQITFGTSHALIEPHQITFTRWILGITRTKIVTKSDAAKVIIDRGMQVGSSIYHIVRLETKRGTRITLGTGVRDRNEAEWIVSEIEKTLQG